MYRHSRLGVILAVSLANCGCGSWFYTGQHPSVRYEATADHMPEDIRRSVRNIEVVADNRKPELRVGGDYGQYVPTAGEGAAGGAAAGVKVTGAMLAEDPRAIILVPFILPLALIAGSIGGAAAAKIEKELAEFREGLADDIIADGNQPLPSEVFAGALIARLKLIDDFVSVTTDGDASLKVTITDITVDTEDKNAIITASARGVLTSTIDGSVLYSKSLEYSERDTLRNWTANENALWDTYVVNARQFLSAELVADMFETIHVRNVLRPLKTETVTGGWSGRTKTHTPTFSWELFLLGDDPYEALIDAQNVAFDLRIFEGSRLAYEARRIRGTSHEVSEPLPGCKELRWSVRPIYQIDGETRAGKWMQYRSGFDQFWNNEALKSHPVTPEFWHYFPEVSTRCST
jgi:hypothetical protein